MAENPTQRGGPRSCPECGLPLDGIDVQAHSADHWGVEPLPNTSMTLVARQRQAALLGRPVPEA